MARQPLKKAEEEIKEKADSADASDAFNDMLDNLDQLRAELTKLSGRVAELGESSARAGSEALRKEGKRAMRNASGILNDVADQSEDVIAQADRFSRERPALAMGIAAAAGFLLALGMSRR